MAYVILFLVVGLGLGFALSQGVSDDETAVWISKISKRNNERQFMTNQKNNRAGMETTAVKRRMNSTMIENIPKNILGTHVRTGDDVLEKRFLDPIDSIEDVSCVLDDGESGVCVFYYQCNVTTRAVITDGSNIINARYKQCNNSVLHVCCKERNIRTSSDINTVSAHKYEDDESTQLTNKPTPNNKGVTELNLDPVDVHDDDVSCVLDNGESGVCVFYYQCNVTTRAVITDGSGIINARQRTCPDILQVCCKSFYLISSTGTTTTRASEKKYNIQQLPELNTVKYINENKNEYNVGSPLSDFSPTISTHNSIKTNDEVTEINLDPIDIKQDDDVSCVLDNGESGVCVFYYQCNVTTRAVITDGSGIINARQRRCPSILQVCCKKNILKSSTGIRYDGSKRPTLAEVNSVDTTHNENENNRDVESYTFDTLPNFSPTIQKYTTKRPLEVTITNLDSKDARDGDVSCVLDDGESGVCVHYYECVVTDGSRWIKFENERCSSVMLQVCCKKTYIKQYQETSPFTAHKIEVRVNRHGIDLPARNSNNKNVDEHKRSITMSNFSDPTIHTLDKKFNKTDNMIDIKLDPQEVQDKVVFRDDDDVSCVLDDGESGVCVFYYQCNVTTRAVITDGSDIINANRKCPSVLQVCCGKTDMKTSNRISDITVADAENKLNNRTVGMEDTTEIDLDPVTSPDDPTCETETGQIGFCVMYYQCEPTSRTVIKDGATIINFRRRTCPNYLEVCCTESIKPTDDMDMSEIMGPLLKTTMNTNYISGNKSSEGTSTYEHTATLSVYIFNIIFLNLLLNI